MKVMPRPLILTSAGFLLAAVLLAALSARADLIPSLVSGPVPDGANFDYNYQILLTPGESVDPIATNGVTCPGPGSTLVQCNPTGTFVTLYDISGFQSTSVSAVNWFATVQLVGVTPSTINASPFDSPTLLNVTWHYIGPTVLAGSSGVTFTGFQIVSSIDGTTNGNFSGQATNDTDAKGDTDQFTGPVIVPASGSVTPTPEPGSLLLVGSGLLGLAGRVRRRKLIA